MTRNTTRTHRTRDSGLVRKLAEVPDPRAVAAEYVCNIDVESVRPSPENDLLYRKVDPASHQFRRLLECVRERGVIESIVDTSDGFIVSELRSYAAALPSGHDIVPERYLDVRRDSMP